MERDAQALSAMDVCKGRRIGYNGFGDEYVSRFFVSVDTGTPAAV
jgi:hypothetical protein